MASAAFKEPIVDRGAAKRERDENLERIARESSERYRRSVDEVNRAREPDRQKRQAEHGGQMITFAEGLAGQDKQCDDRRQGDARRKRGRMSKHQSSKAQMRTHMA